MFDTFKLLVSQGEFKILKDEAFTPAATVVRMARGRSYCVQNPTKDELRNGIYKPRLTLSKWRGNSGYDIGLKIEFSAPKLIFGNNFDELKNSDFKKVVCALHAKLIEMHVSISEDTLSCAQVIGMHPSKNTNLENSSSNLVVSTIERLNISKRLDNCRTDFLNGGQALRFHANSFELTFYDKIKDLRQSKISDKRSMENDNCIQIPLLDNTLSNKEVLRMEVRLNETQKIRDVLKKCGIEKQELIFKDLFDKEVSGKILTHFWENYVEPSLETVLLSQENDDELLYRIKQSGFGNNKALRLLGAMKIVKDTGYSALQKAVPQHTFYRIRKDLEKINDYNYRRSKVFKDIKKSLKNMYPLKLQAI